jgi:hypothetical protein
VPEWTSPIPEDQAFVFLFVVWTMLMALGLLVVFNRIFSKIIAISGWLVVGSVLLILGWQTWIIYQSRSVLINTTVFAWQQSSWNVLGWLKNYTTAVFH